MPPTAGPEGIKHAAMGLLAGGMAGDELTQRVGVVGQPAVVVDDGDDPFAWFVPVTVGERLAGFFQFLRDGTLMRFSAFPHAAGTFDRCPVAADWCDGERVRARARASAPTATAGRAVLTFDRSPDRLVWRVPLTEPDGRARVVFVAGTYVYEPPPGDSVG